MRWPRARAFAEPLIAGETLDTARTRWRTPTPVAAILKSMGGSEAMQAASYLVYACPHLNKPQEVIAKAFGESYAALAVETTKLVRMQQQARGAEALPGRPAGADRERAQDAAGVLARPARVTAAAGVAPADPALLRRPPSGRRRRRSRARRCRCSRRWPTAWASGR
jgi:(p)ppGpp synthase/HD superfamily hydrolase